MSATYRFVRELVDPFEDRRTLRLHRLTGDATEVRAQVELSDAGRADVLEDLREQRIGEQTRLIEASASCVMDGGGGEGSGGGGEGRAAWKSQSLEARARAPAGKKNEV